jgi:large subunit ribosomal protein L3
LSIGLVGKKSGMSRLFQEDGTSVPVTVISVAANFIADIKTHEKHGYSAVVVSKNTSKNLTKSSTEFFKKQNISNGELFEFRTEETDELKVGHHLTADIFEVGKMVDVTGTSKGKGYAGVIKRNNFAMQDATHGNSLAHRAHGSIGQCQTPGRVWKGKKMSGHMGHETKTIQSLELMGADVQNNLLYVKGAVPGFNGSTLKITPAVKQR